MELFQPNVGILQDSVTAEQIRTDEYEFIQGIFYYAGLDPMNPGRLFEPSDPNARKLEEASEKLNAELRRLWAQGVDLGLTFYLFPRHPAIEFMAKDPSVRSRPTRMSERSTGATQFFRLSVVLHARRTKNPANKYIYLFDEPGIYLHPRGQKDLIQVFEKLSSDSQIVYATHSLFLLNQNFPERHRLIIRDQGGTRVDQKPYRNNWQLATDALGVHLTANILFCSCVLLVEGDSDAIYIYELLRYFNQKKRIDADANMLGIYAYSDLSNLRFLIQTFKREGSDTRMLVLFDGDKQGNDYKKQILPLCQSKDVGVHQLEGGFVIEDYAVDASIFYEAAKMALKEAAVATEKEILDDSILESWKEHQSSSGRTEEPKAKKPKAEAGYKNDKIGTNKKDGRVKNRADWFTEVAKEACL